MPCPNPRPTIPTRSSTPSPLTALPLVSRRGRTFLQPGMSADPTLEFLTSELSSEDPSKCVECISRLQVVALSLGAEKTVSLLIPYLAAQTENVRRRLEPPPKITRSAAPRPAPPLGTHRSHARAPLLQFSDEVLVTVAEVLPFLVDMVGDCEPAGTPGGKAAILNLLGDLCHQEETTGATRPSPPTRLARRSRRRTQTLVVPIALKLARTLEWFTPRVSACGLALSFSRRRRRVGGGAPRRAPRDVQGGVTTTRRWCGGRRRGASPSSPRCSRSRW